MEVGQIATPSAEMNKTSPQGSSPESAPSDANQSSDKDDQSLKMRELPPIEEIYKSIPAEGTDIQSLTKKFETQVDETNVRLFTQLIKAVCTFESKFRVKPNPQLPTDEQIQDIIREAKKPAPPKPQLEPKERREISSHLLDGAQITFSETPELVRGASNMCPASVYRVFYETSATLSKFVSKDTHPKHREKPDLKLQEDNAFQAIEDFSGHRDMSKQRLERHLCWQQKKDPSSFISAFNHLDPAKRRCNFHYYHSKRIGQRISVAEINTSGLVSATVRGKLKETVKIIVKGIMGSSKKFVTYRDVQIPCWVHKSAVPQDQSAISFEQLKASGAEMWLSLTELWASDLKVSCSKGHSYEWLCCGSIPLSRIIRVMPFDGTTLHEKETSTVVRSIESTESWIFNWGKQMWVLDAHLARLSPREGEQN